MNKLNKALIGTAAAAAMAVSATPAVAKHRDNDKIDAGDVIAGALIIGGIAAIASAASKKDRYGYNDRDYRYNDNRRYKRGDYYRGDRYRGDRYRSDRYRGDYRYDRAGYRYNYDISPRRAVEKCVRAVERHLRRHRADVTQIRDVDRTRYGYRVKGNVVLQTGYNDDRGRFTCVANGQGRPSLRFRGLWNGR
ncbi:hypothetical protein [Sphingorhabdus sp. Alg239-R122]|uniref:hypothetical protein n=1 Tax=Sphingorhabdus sp. Alg239-R122 TaxID=2305989 RepID=UPI0013D91ABD|nr:hypothetical protein [Sphingorhabdus sp. Alg239-R122]